MTGGGKLSGYAYVAAYMRAPDSGSDRGICKIKTSVERFCDHTSTICMTQQCVDSWSIDYELMFSRTNAGRKFIEANLTPQARVVLEAIRERHV